MSILEDITNKSNWRKERTFRDGAVLLEYAPDLSYGDLDEAAAELKRLQAVKSELLRLIDASAEFDSVTTFNRDDEDNELCAYCLTNPGEPHKKGCRAVDAHKAFLQAVSSAREVLRGEQ